MNDDFPPLPETDYLLAIPDMPYDRGYTTTQDGYTADQMRVYARAARAAAPADMADATNYAHSLACGIHAKHYSEVTQWRPLPELIGLLTQIDNMVAGMSRAAAPAQPAPQPLTDEQIIAAARNNCAGCVNENGIGGPCRTCVDSSNRVEWDDAAPAIEVTDPDLYVSPYRGGTYAADPEPATEQIERLRAAVDEVMRHHFTHNREAMTALQELIDAADAVVLAA